MTAKENVLKNFDFEKVVKVMNFVGWRYWDTPGKEVTVDELKAVASGCIDSLLSKETVTSSGTGGFVAKWEYEDDEGTEKFLKLEFVLTTAYEFA
jgi:hypothetical protein